VAADGSGDFCTVQGAVDFVPAGNSRPREIFIRNGVYEEIVFVTNKDHLTFLGEDRARTIIQYANNENFNYRGLSRNIYRQTFGVNADDFTLENLTVRNTTPKGGSQAEALRVDGQRCAVRNVDFYSFQDTLKLSGTVFVVDFIWGYGTCYFTNCEIRCVNNGSCITQIRNDASHFGDVFVDCRLSHALGVTNATLSRIEIGRFPYSHVAWIHCAMDSHIVPSGWRFTPGPNPPDNLRFWEYQTTDLNGTNRLDVSRRASVSRQLTADEAAQMRDVKYVLGGWVPQFSD
jgi:pectin methylesterase-like acyl-CoA thioesterase